MKNPLQSLQDHGQSVWLDYLRRSLITGGALKRLIEEDGLRGLTSNPSIFEKAIAGSNDYREMLEAPESQGIDAMALVAEGGPGKPDDQSSRHAGGHPRRPAVDQPRRAN